MFLRKYMLILTFPSWVFYHSQDCGGNFLSPAEKGPFRSPPGKGNNKSTIPTHSIEPTISKLLHAVIQFLVKNKNPVIALLALAFFVIYTKEYFEKRSRKYIVDLIGEKGQKGFETVWFEKVRELAIIES